MLLKLGPEERKVAHMYDKKHYDNLFQRYGRLSDTTDPAFTRVFARMEAKIIAGTKADTEAANMFFNVLQGVIEELEAIKEGTMV